MANTRLDPGSTRAILEDLCKRLGHEEVARLLGKAVSTVRAYCDPGNKRQIPERDQRRLGCHMFFTHGECVHWPDLEPYGNGGTPPGHKKGMDEKRRVA